MRRIFLVAFVSLFALVACDKLPDNLIVTVNEAGSVKIKVVDNDKKP